MFTSNKKKGFWHNEKLREAADFSLEIIKIIIISLAIIIPVRYFLIQPFYVKGASMEPNFYNHEYLIIDEISYRFNLPARGDIVVFRPPHDKTGDFFIKRIIGLPQERIVIKNGKIKIYNQDYPDGIILDESLYLDLGLSTFGEINQTLGSDEYFVLGDNRSASLDSRTFGPVKRESIVGKVWLRGWPFARITLFKSTPYNL
jgi:signal peptidase I